MAVAVTVTRVSKSLAPVRRARNASANGSRTVMVGQLAHSAAVGPPLLASSGAVGEKAGAITNPRLRSAAAAFSSAAGGASGRISSAAPLTRG